VAAILRECVFLKSTHSLQELPLSNEQDKCSELVDFKVLHHLKNIATSLRCDYDTYTNWWFLFFVACPSTLWFWNQSALTDSRFTFVHLEIWGQVNYKTQNYTRGSLESWLKLKTTLLFMLLLHIVHTQSRGSIATVSAFSNAFETRV